MIAALVFAAAFAAPLVVRPEAAGAPGPRFVRLRLDVSSYGIRGPGEILIDRAEGRFVRRFETGPASEREGFDGVRAWRADATGMPRIEGNADERGDILAWSYLLARAPADAAGGPLRPHGAGDCPVRVRYRGLSRAVDVGIDRRSGLVVRVVRRLGDGVETTRFGDYRTVRGLIVPFALTTVSPSGVWTARVRAVETPARLGGAAFAPPAPPRDATLAHPTHVPMLERGPVVTVRIDGGPPMRFGVDTGGQNVITTAAARRLGLRLTGGAAVSGVGAGVAAIRFATARSVRIGAAEMRDQPFVVLDLGGFPADGLVGYELLARFAARFDFKHRTFALAPAAGAFGAGGITVPIEMNDKQPQVRGAIDGIPGVLTIDTGSDGWVDVNTPFVRAHRLVARYRARVSGIAFGGVGGSVRAAFARAGTVDLGAARLRDVLLRLSDARAGVSANPSVAANVGDEILRRFVVVFDYRRGIMRLLPGGDPHEPAWTDRSGLRLAGEAGRLLVADVLTGTPAARAGIRPGAAIVTLDERAVTANDRARVAAALAGKPGTRVRLTFERGETVTIRLQNYFP
ncbi:MAG TPA: aspartyl protease family protein [Candidatus Elarobacter sp.]